MMETDMAEAQFPKRRPAMDDQSRRPIPDEYRPRQLRLDPIGEHPATAQVQTPMSEIAPSEGVNLHKLEAELARQPLDEIARLVRGLTYGEMIELAASMWRVQPAGSGITENNLPDILYRWSTTHQC
jgi:hypothetical protein